MIQKWKLLNSQVAFNHPWCIVRQDEIELPNGKIIDDYFVNIRPDIALVLPITPQQEIVFVRQYRHGVQEILLELPAGAFNPQQESPIDAAKRELVEETGYESNEWNYLAHLYDNPVKDTNQIHLFIAQDVQLNYEPNLDVTEEIEIVLIPLNSIMERIAQGEISVAGSLAAIFLGLNFLGISGF